MKVHLIGVGGIGVSALAQYYLVKGHEVSGSDLVASEITDMLKEKGIKITINPKAQNPNSKQRLKFQSPKQELPELVVFSPAVKSENAELKFFKKNKVKCVSYPEAVGELTKEYYTIAVAGAHGKSTTTAMIALVLTAAGLDPTVIVGTKVREFGNSNFRAGQSKLLVIEACEYDDSFLFYSPKIIVVTNVDKEHLDYFKTFANVKRAFRNFILRLPEDGSLVFNGDDEELSVIARSTATKQSPSFRLLRFARNDAEAPRIKKLMKVPGAHNVSNALAVLQVARILVIPDSVTFKALSEFTGTWRRFDVSEKNIGGNPPTHKASARQRKVILVNDYAHHPNEILATLKAAREKYKKKIIWCVFQPHQHQRTFYLFRDFVKVFSLLSGTPSAAGRIDKIIITDIYDVAGRETKTINREVSAKKLVEAIKKDSVSYLAMDKIIPYLKENISAGQVLILMGAGNIYDLNKEL